MKIQNVFTRYAIAALIVAALFGATLPQSAFAKQGATDPIPGTSKGATNGGGGGGGGGCDGVDDSSSEYSVTAKRASRSMEEAGLSAGAIDFNFG